VREKLLTCREKKLSERQSRRLSLTKSGRQDDDQHGDCDPKNDKRDSPLVRITSGEVALCLIRAMVRLLRARLCISRE